VPLRALGLGAGLLGSTSCPLTLLGGSESRGGSKTSNPSVRRSRRRLSSSNPRCHLGWRNCLQNPSPYPKGWGPL
jgi:hypothetical protein